MSVFHQISKAWRQNGGFTVLELLAVFAMLAIIASLVAPKYQGLILDSKVKACQSNVQMITKAAKMYYEVHNEWPMMDDLVKGEYIEKDVYCPVGNKSEGTDYDYIIDNNNGDVTCKNADNHNPKDES